jgi:hypothetical protein
VLPVRSRRCPLELPEKLNPEMRKAAPVLPEFDTVTEKAWLLCVIVGFAPMTLMFLFVHETELDHEQVPAGT